MAPNIRYFDVGGGDAIAALALDHLTFSIPEPGSMALMLAGILALFFAPRVRRISTGGFGSGASGPK